MKLLIFEWKKLFRTKVYPIFLVATILLIATLFIRNVTQQEAIQAEKIDHFSKLMVEVYSEIVQFNEYLKSSGPNPEIEARVEAGTQLYSELKVLLEAIDNKDWKTELETEINVYHYAFEYLEFPGTRFGLAPEVMEKEIKLNEELLKLNLPKEHLNLSIQTSVFMKMALSLFLSPLGYIVLLIVFASIVTREFEDKNIQLVYTLPVSRLGYITVKFISLFLASLLWLVTVFLLIYLLPHFFGQNEGEIFNYPLYDFEYSFITTGEFIIQSMVYGVSFTAFALALLVFLGNWIRNTILTIISTIVILGGGFLIISYGIDFLINPFSYQMVEHAILDTPSFYPFGAIVLFVEALILLSLTLILNRNRGI